MCVLCVLQIILYKGRDEPQSLSRPPNYGIQRNNNYQHLHGCQGYPHGHHSNRMSGGFIPKSPTIPGGGQTFGAMPPPPVPPQGGHGFINTNFQQGAQQIHGNQGNVFQFPEAGYKQEGTLAHSGPGQSPGLAHSGPGQSPHLHQPPQSPHLAQSGPGQSPAAYSKPQFTFTKDGKDLASSLSEEKRITASALLGLAESSIPTTLAGGGGLNPTTLTTSLIPSTALQSQPLAQATLRYQGQQDQVGDAMLSAINYNDTEMIADNNFDVNVEDALRTMNTASDSAVDEALRNINTSNSSTFDLFEEGSNQLNDYAMDNQTELRLSPDSFTDPGGSFGMGDSNNSLPGMQVDQDSSGKLSTPVICCYAYQSIGR